MTLRIYAHRSYRMRPWPRSVRWAESSAGQVSMPAYDLLPPRWTEVEASAEQSSEPEHGG